MRTIRPQLAIGAVIFLLGAGQSAMAGSREGSGDWGGSGVPCIGSLEGTGATSVLDASGQGNFSCSAMTPGPDGGAMAPVASGVNVVVQGGKKAIVTVSGGLPGKEIDAVYIKSSGNGARCLYSFSNYTTQTGPLENAGQTISSSDVIVCADGVGNPPPPPPVEPISTTADGCEGTIAAGAQTLGGLAVVTGISLDGQTQAVCSPPGSAQVQCVNLCQKFQARSESPECAAANAGRALTDGQMDLDACRPCDLSDLQHPPARDQDGNPLFYCWEYVNSVVRNPPLLKSEYPNAPGTDVVPGTEGDPVPRAAGSMLPHKAAWSNNQETHAYNGCTTTTTYLNGRPYTYTTCY